MQAHRIPHPDAPHGLRPPPAHAALPRFGLVVVGDEILSGRRTDQHVAKMIALLAERGLLLSYVHMVADDRPRLVRLLQDLFASGDVVMCCGGIGSTPDDHTRQAAAQAAGVELALHPTARDLIMQRMQETAQQKGEVFDAQRPDNIQRLHMGMLPANAEIVPNPYNRIAGFSVGHAHFFPGFPVMAHPMMAWVLDTYYAQWHHRHDWAEHALIVKGSMEAPLTPLMEAIEAQYSGIKVFSLPSVDHPVHGAHIELGVKGPAQLAALAYKQLQQGLQSRHVDFICVPSGRAKIGA